MDNEEKILAVLEKMDARLDKLEQGQTKLEQGQAKLTQGQAKLGQAQAKLEQGQADLRTEMNIRFDDLEASLGEVLADVGKVEDRIKQHEKEFHSIGIK